MPSVRFPHVFTLLMLLSFLGAFVIPPTYTDKAKPRIQGLFAPVSWPASGVGRWISGRFGDETWTDRRDAETVKSENAELRAMVFNLSERLSRELARTAQQQLVSPLLRDRGMWVSAIGGDSATRDTLQVRGPLPAGVAHGSAVVYAGGVVGLVEHPGLAGAQVRLVTDVGFRVRCGFARLRKNAEGKPELVRIATPPVVIEGAGQNALRVVRTGMTVEEAQKSGLLDKEQHLVEGLWAFVDDRDWPQILNGQPVGQVEKIVPRTDIPLFAEVTLHPATNLSRLRDVLVVTKE